MIRRIAMLALAPFALTACHSGGSGSATAAPTPASLIRTDELRRDLFAFAADSFHGRQTGTRDAQRAAEFIVSRLQTLGLEPAGDSMYVQRVPLLRESFAPATHVAVIQDGRTTTLLLGDDVLPVTSFGEGMPEPRRSAGGALVFAGYGLPADLAKVDIAGKVVVVIHGAPPGSAPDVAAQLESQRALGERLGRLLPHQPAGIVFLMSGGATAFYSQLAPELMRHIAPAGQEETATDAARPLPMVVLGIARAGSPLLPSGWPNDTRPQPLGRAFSGHVELRRTPFMAYNVVAVVRGSDPALNQSYVAYGAHYDHIGIVRGAGPDTIANGADDDGSGSMSLLAIAHAMQWRPPRRSVLFVWHVGEEQGLLGSSYFTEHPTVPIDSIVAQLNADMIGRNAPSLLYIVGPRAAPGGQSRVLGAIVDSVNAAQAMPFAIDREWDDANHPEHIYQRSDHYNYAKRGIPIVFFTAGLHEDYHKPSDEPAKIDYLKLTRVARLMLGTGTAVANRTTRPH